MNGERVIEEAKGLHYDRQEPLLKWARSRVEKKMREVEAKGHVIPAAHLDFDDRCWLLAEYLVWRATPEPWRTKYEPRTELEFAGRWGISGTASLMFLRRAVGFEKLLKEALKFGISSTERVLDAKNAAHTIVMEQRHLQPKERDARFLAELSKMEGLSKSEPLVSITNTTNTLQLGGKLDTVEAEKVLADAFQFFAERKALPREVPVGPADAALLPDPEGSETRRHEGQLDPRR